MPYSVGDMVMVAPDIVGRRSGSVPWGVNDRMRSMAGYVFEITSANFNSGGTDNRLYRLSGNYYSWDASILIPATPEAMAEYKNKRVEEEKFKQMSIKDKYKTVHKRFA